MAERSARPPCVVYRDEGLAVLRAGNPGPMTLDGTNTCVVGHEAVAIIDPGPDDDRQLEAIEEVVAGRAVTHVLLTHAHADHSALAPCAAQHFGAPLAASAKTLERLGESGRALEDGGEFEVGSRCRVVPLFAPGHSADHVCYLVSPGRRLCSGDLVLGTGSSAILHPDGRVGDCLASLARLIALRPAVLLPGHGPVVEPATPRLEAYRGHRVQRDRDVRRALRDGHVEVPEIRAAVYGPLPPGLAWAADASIAAHLAFLAEQGEDVPAFDRFGASEEEAP